MKRYSVIRRLFLCNSQQRALDAKGFSLVEIAIVLMLLGMLTVGGLMFFGKSTQSHLRRETKEQLELVKKSLLMIAEVRGHLPLATATTGVETYNVVKPYIPWGDMGVAPFDPWKRFIRYERHAMQATVLSTAWTTADQNALCRELLKAPPAVGTKSSLNGPLFFESQANEMAAVLISGGALDADGDGNFLDGGNASGSPYYKRAPETSTFDDLAVSLSRQELLSALYRGGYCAYSVTVTNNNAGTTAYVYNATKAKDVGIVGMGAETSITIKVPLDHQLEIRSLSSGAGVVLASTPVTPLVVTANVSVTLP